MLPAQIWWTACAAWPRGQRFVQRANVTTMQAADSVGTRVRDRLTPKEMQIVALIAQGWKNKEIALQLGTKEQVIKNYLRSIYDKTGVSRPPGAGAVHDSSSCAGRGCGARAREAGAEQRVASQQAERVIA